MWGVGLLAYIMLYGINPFVSKNDNVVETMKNIINCSYTFPSETNVSHDAQNFISMLLQQQPEERMTATQALQHPWFVCRLPKSALTLKRGSSEIKLMLKEFVSPKYL